MKRCKACGRPAVTSYVEKKDELLCSICFLWALDCGVPMAELAFPTFHPSGFWPEGEQEWKR